MNAAHETTPFRVAATTEATEQLMQLPAPERARIRAALSAFAHTAFEHHLVPAKLGLRRGDYDIIVQLCAEPVGLRVLKIRPHLADWRLEVIY